MLLLLLVRHRIALPAAGRREHLCDCGRPSCGRLLLASVTCATGIRLLHERHFRLSRLIAELTARPQTKHQRLFGPYVNQQ